MPKRKDAPFSPERWAGIMLALLGMCAIATAAVFLLGGLDLRKLLWVLLLLALAAFSVLLRYLGSPPRRD